MNRIAAEYEIDPAVRRIVGPLFDLTLPTGWRDRSVYCVAGPSQDAFPPTITVTVEQKQEVGDASSFAAASLKELQGQLDGFEFRSQGERSLCGRTVPYNEFTWTSSEGLSVLQLQYFIWMAPFLIVVTTSARRDADDQQEKLFAAVLERLQVGAKGV